MMQMNKIGKAIDGIFPDNRFRSQSVVFSFFKIPAGDPASIVTGKYLFWGAMGNVCRMGKIVGFKIIGSDDASYLYPFVGGYGSGGGESVAVTDSALKNVTMSIWDDLRSEYVIQDIPLGSLLILENNYRNIRPSMINPDKSYFVFNDTTAPDVTANVIIGIVFLFEQ